jgi:hypothetical protein
VASIIDYFRRAPYATDLIQHFQAVFGIELSTFQHEFALYLDGLLG